MSPTDPDDPHTLEPVIQQSTPSLIASQVREAIARGHIAPGSQLHESALAKQLGVSRGPLREGLQRLTQEGLLVSHRNRGLFLIEMSAANIRDMYLAREGIERTAAAQIHRQDPAPVATELLVAVEQMARAARAGDVVAVSDADVRFHQALVAGARSPRLRRAHETVLTETRMCIHALEPTYSDPHTRVAEHQAIAESFRPGGAEHTDELLMAHMADALERLIAQDP